MFLPLIGAWTVIILSRLFWYAFVRPVPLKPLSLRLAAVHAWRRLERPLIVTDEHERPLSESNMLLAAWCAHYIQQWVLTTSNASPLIAKYLGSTRMQREWTVVLSRFLDRVASLGWIQLDKEQREWLEPTSPSWYALLADLFQRFCQQVMSESSTPRQDADSLVHFRKKWLRIISPLMDSPILAWLVANVLASQTQIHLEQWSHPQLFKLWLLHLFQTRQVQECLRIVQRPFTQPLMDHSLLAPLLNSSQSVWDICMIRHGLLFQLRQIQSDESNNQNVRSLRQLYVLVRLCDRRLRQLAFTPMQYLTPDVSTDLVSVLQSKQADMILAWQWAYQHQLQVPLIAWTLSKVPSTSMYALTRKDVQEWLQDRAIHEIEETIQQSDFHHSRQACLYVARIARWRSLEMLKENTTDEKLALGSRFWTEMVRQLDSFIHHSDPFPLPLHAAHFSDDVQSIDDKSSNASMLPQPMTREAILDETVDRLQLQMLMLQVLFRQWEQLESNATLKGNCRLIHSAYASLAKDLESAVFMRLQFSKGAETKSIWKIDIPQALLMNESSHPNDAQQRKNSSTKYISYQLQVERHGQSFSVLRRFSDFVALDKQLQRQFHFKATLPGTSMMGLLFRLRPEFVEARREALLQYLKKLLLDSEISQSETLKKFLTEPNFNTLLKSASISAPIENVKQESVSMVASAIDRNDADAKYYDVLLDDPSDENRAKFIQSWHDLGQWLLEQEWHEDAWQRHAVMRLLLKEWGNGEQNPFICLTHGLQWLVRNGIFSPTQIDSSSSFLDSVPIPNSLKEWLGQDRCLVLVQKWDAFLERPGALLSTAQSLLDEIFDRL